MYNISEERHIITYPRWWSDDVLEILNQECFKRRVTLTIIQKKIKWNSITLYFTINGDHENRGALNLLLFRLKSKFAVYNFDLNRKEDTNDKPKGNT